MTLTLDHVGVVVSSLEEAADLLGQRLRLSKNREQNEPGRPDRSVFYRSGDVDVEIIEVLDPEARASRLRGERLRIEHLAFAVADLDPEIERLRSLGFVMSEPQQIGGRRTAFSDPGTSGGMMIQLVERHAK
jgi:catechol 2,3-dioxygenase-like lactoylglutathione lyase family enzyme